MAMRWDFARAALLSSLVSLPVSLALLAMPLATAAEASANDMLLLTNQYRYAIGGSELGGVRQLWDAPYHRLGLMHPNAISIGWGHSELNSRQNNVGDIVYNFGIR